MGTYCFALACSETLQKKSLYNFSGESSAGKSSLVNLIFGEEILPHHLLNTTSTICEMKFGEERKLIIHYEYDKEQNMRPLPTIIPLKTEEECGKSFHDQIEPYVTTESATGQKRLKYARVEIFWPHELLEVICFLKFFSIYMSRF